MNRDRYRAIVSSPEARGRLRLAQELASSTNYSVKRARRILAGAASGKLPKRAAKPATESTRPSMAPQTSGTPSLNATDIYRRRAETTTHSAGSVDATTQPSPPSSLDAEEIYRRRAASVPATQGQRAGVVYAPTVHLITSQERG